MRRRCKIDIFRSLQSLRRQFKCPCEHDQSDGPIRNVEDRKNLRDALSECPAGDYVGDRNFVNVAALQLDEEIVDFHFFGAKTSAMSALKRGLPRRSSSIGSTLMRAISLPARSRYARSISSIARSFVAQGQIDQRETKF